MDRPPPKPNRGPSRFTAGLPAVLHWDGKDFDCRAVDLSRGGVLLVGDLPSAAGPAVATTLASAAGDLRVKLAAHVRRVSSDRDGSHIELGLEFGAITGAALDALERLLSRVIEGVAPAALEALPANASPQQVRAALDSVPPAHRAQLAVRGNPREREILMQDTDLNVLDGLARNPNLTPPEIRTLLRNKQLLPRTMQTLARDSRWTSSEELKIAIACHPNTPFPVAKRLIEALTPAGRKKALTQPGLNPTLRLQLGTKSR